MKALTMKDYITQNAVDVSTAGAKVAYTGAATAVISGVTLNQVEVQLIGVAIGAMVGVLGLIISAIAKYYERKDRIQVLLNKGDWDGKERRIDGTR
jgi:hypothetical protein